MRDFKQAYVSNILPHFKKGFMEKWGFKEYTDPNSPAVFLGIYSQQDMNVFRQHKSYKILHFGGNDLHPPQINLVKNESKVFLVGYGWIGEVFRINNLRYKEVIIPLKDFSEFTPTVLGDKIYIYKGIYGDRPDYFKWQKVVEPLQKTFGKDRIIFTNHKPIEQLKEEYYNNCFVYVKPNERGGSTSMWELGHMGRKTITFNQGDVPNVLNYKSFDEIVSHIKNEESKIGTLQNEVSEQTKNIFVGEEWLNLDFYYN